MSDEAKSSWEDIVPSEMSQRVFNPIRNIVDQLEIPKGTADKPLIPLSIGDPTVFGNLPFPPTAEDELINRIRDRKHNGYPPSTGYPDARHAIAERFSIPGKEPIKPTDVVIASGCSGALAIALPTLLNPGDNILLPQPGFSLYEVICKTHEIEARFYRLDPEASWSVDLNHAATLVDSRTKAILINNPSNPCGSNFTKKHLEDIVAFAHKHKLPIIADEIYAEMVFKDQTFTYIASVSDTVPILSVGGLAKQYLVPGWRVGWIVIHDRNNVFSKVRKALTSMSQIILGANSIIQSAIPHMLRKTPPSYYTNLMAVLEEQAMFCNDRLSKIDGLRVIKPQGAMYVMVQVQVEKFRSVKSDLDFCQKLLTEELVFVLPGSCFRADNFFRIVYCAPMPMLEEACDRIERFCTKLRK